MNNFLRLNIVRKLSFGPRGPKVIGGLTEVISSFYPLSYVRFFAKNKLNELCTKHCLNAYVSHQQAKETKFR